MERLRSMPLEHFTQYAAYGAMAASGVFALSLAWLMQDYRAWLAFGTGGTPANLAGYMKITKFRVMRVWAGDDLKDPSTLSSIGPSYLSVNLPERRGPPPSIVSRTLPQRQIPAAETLPKDVYERLHDIPRKYAEQYPDVLTLDKSVTEGRTTDAIYSKPNRTQGARDPALGDEIAHVHPAENSLHVWLTQPDAKKVVAAGWGERFPLASLHMVDSGWTFLYAPRSMAEVDTIEEIVKAGVGHLTGRHI